MDRTLRLGGRYVAMIRSLRGEVVLAIGDGRALIRISLDPRAARALGEALAAAADDAAG